MVMMQEKVVFVTGAARGIGRYIAHTFAREGARLAVADIESLDNVSRELREMETDVLAVNADVRNEAQVQAAVDRVVGAYGHIDVLVNNAGIVPHFAWGVPRWAPAKSMEKDFWDRVLDTNLGGAFLCTKHVLPHMERRGSGHVISLHGGGSGIGAAPYVVSKEAIRVFTRFVAEEEREANVCIVCLSPGGAIATEDAPEEARQRMPGPELASNRFVLAAAAPIAMSGHLLDLREGQLVIAD
ncbi:MAG: SDR family NAD(P)-dependent oxidoreductase [Chloroflexi bacterium]|nr:SDR family NAD(P)-dependent oxidoreductase [Chloroflexota bacterium]